MYPHPRCPVATQPPAPRPSQKTLTALLPREIADLLRTDIPQRARVYDYMWGARDKPSPRPGRRPSEKRGALERGQRWLDSSPRHPSSSSGPCGRFPARSGIVQFLDIRHRAATQPEHARDCAGKAHPSCSELHQAVALMFVAVLHCIHGGAAPPGFSRAARNDIRGMFNGRETPRPRLGACL